MAYVSSKGALNTLTLSMARALAPEVRVNALCPGGMLGNWTRKILTEKQYQERVERAKTEFPLHRPIWPHGLRGQDDQRPLASHLCCRPHCTSGSVREISR